MPLPRAETAVYPVKRPGFSSVPIPNAETDDQGADYLRTAPDYFTQGMSLGGRPGIIDASTQSPSALTLQQQQAVALAKARKRKAQVLATGNRMRERDAPVGGMPADIRVNRTFEDVGMPDTSGADSWFSPYVISEMNAQRGQEQGIGPMAPKSEPLGEADAVDGAYGFYDKGGTFNVANHKDHVILQDPKTGKLSVYARSPDMEESGLMGLARAALSGFGAGAPSRMASGAAKAVEEAAPMARGAAETVQAFDRAGVDPSLVTALQNRATSVAANMLRNTPAGGPIERGVRTSIDQAGQSAERLAGTLSPVGDIPTAGSSVRSGASEFIQATVPKKQEELYGAARELIGNSGRSAVPRTMQVLDDLDSRIKDPAIREFLTDPNVSGLAQTIRDAGARGVTFDDLRQLRTEVRGLKPSQDAKVGLNKTSISKIYTALTKDMENMALASGGDDALSSLRKADRFSYLMHGEAGDLQSTTAPVRVLRDLVDGKSDEQIYTKLKTWSSKGAAADVKKLELVKRAIPSEKWSDFTGAFLRNMGRARPGAVQTADAEEWSPSTFMTSYESMSPRARTLMFGEMSSLRSSLDDLLTVAGSLKNVQKLGNPSGSGAHLAMAGMGAGFFAAPLTTLSALATGNVAARIMTSPRAVRWLTRAYKIARDTRNQPAARSDMEWRAHLRGLAALASTDPEIAAPLGKLLAQIRDQARGEPDTETKSEEPPQGTGMPLQVPM